MTTHYLFFERISHPGSGFKFPCNAEGYVDETALPAAQVRQLLVCTNNRWAEFRQPVVVPANAISAPKAQQ